MADWDSSSWAETRFSAEVLAASPASLVRLSRLTKVTMAATKAVMTTIDAEITLDAVLMAEERDFWTVSATFVASA